ncbi:hypothetical protein EJ05DRAFT_487007 [Pseudovirgaria hyperparasitica]|uniref:Centromere protein X n=1 Tax=Pseudovirgaria hyperparasitica TaxID=470096 RepID=A0A6A6W7F7_9PEZI|nr:uncharacterized protein EJ05DRAFT_487007 [Pseudovirgaria hyperparasitica]KAF2757011.1 hypothetical protein EJ05DRAFT_487007 [Pseudovirgaria hyperparasitica]
MAPATASNPSKRKGPAFKPPRPVNNGAAGPSTTSKAGVGGKSGAKNTTSKGLQPATMTISSDAEPEEDQVDEAEEERQMSEEIDDLLPEPTQEEAKPAIPPKLLARLLYEGFEDKDMRIGREGMTVAGKYMETFIREAIARAGFERRESEANGGISDGFLQVEDLEKLAPQLLLDF